jgi:hypothetical protein
MKKKIIKKPFDLEAYKNGAKIQTRDGHEVRIVCTNAENPRFPIIALAKLYNEEEVVVHYTLEGKALLADVIHQNDLVIVEEVKGPEYWSEDISNTISGFEISPSARITEIDGAHNIEAFYNVFATKSQAKSAKAMARISQILANDIEHFGGVVTDEEWEDDDLKYVIYRRNNNISSIAVTKFEYCFLAFHTAAQRDLFLTKYRDLVKDYLMLR